MRDLFIAAFAAIVLLVSPAAASPPFSSTPASTIGAATGGCGSHQYVTGVNGGSPPTCAQPAAADVSGLAASATTDTTNAANISSGTITRPINSSGAAGVVATGSASGVAIANEKDTTISGTSTTADILRFLTVAGSQTGTGGVSGIVSISAQDTATGGNAWAATYQILSTGNGTSQATLAIIGSAQVRGTSPVSSVSLANDGGGGGLKIQMTTAGSGISGANVKAVFFGTAY